MHQINVITCQNVTDINISFCRTLLASVHRDVKAFAPRVHLTKDAWVWCAGRDHWEFHGPDKYYWHGNADNAYDARAKGWMAWLAHSKAPGYERRPWAASGQGGAAPGHGGACGPGE